MRKCVICGQEVTARLACSPECESDREELASILDGRQPGVFLHARMTAFMKRWGFEPRAVFTRAERRCARRYGEYGRVLLRDPCAYCGAPASTVDHIEPLAEGGEHDWTNFTGACGSCNSSKSSHGMLLWLADA